MKKVKIYKIYTKDYEKDIFFNIDTIKLVLTSIYNYSLLFDISNNKYYWLIMDKEFYILYDNSIIDIIEKDKFDKIKDYINYEGEV